MADGYDKSDWTVDLQLLGDGGSVHWGGLRGVFVGLSAKNRLQIVWRSAFPADADFHRMHQAALQAIRDAVTRRRASGQG